MADTTTRTKKLTREQIAAIVGNNPRAVKLFETLTEDVSATLPEAIDQVQLSALFSLHGADGSKGASQHAIQMAAEVQVAVAATQRIAASVASMRDEIDVLRAELQDARARLSSDINRLQVDVKDALTLTTGV